MQPKLHLNTSQRLTHAFACEASHVYPGQAILRSGEMRCPKCGKPVVDITDTPLGQSYLAFARPDLGAKR